MRKIVITLVMGLVVFVATLMVTNWYTTDKAEKHAEQRNDLLLDSFCNELEMDILLTQRSAYNFLSFLFYAKTYNEHEQFTISKTSVPIFKQYVYDYLLEFLNLNQFYNSAMFVVDSVVSREYFGMNHAFVPTMEHGSTEKLELSGKYDFMNSKHYLQLKTNRKVFWAMPSNSSRVAGKLINIYIPLVLEDNRFFGAFIVSIGVDAVTDKLRQHLPYGEDKSQMLIIDETGVVIASFPNDSIQVVNNEKYYTYERKTDYATWTIRTVCRTDAVYEEAEETYWVIMLTSVFGMILMFVCCYVAFRQISRNMRQKASVESELKTASELQMSILKPLRLNSKHVCLENYIHPAVQVGGDLYDYVVADDKVLAIIGDVSGKGLPAALFMTQVISLFRNAVRYTLEPKEIIEQINESLAENNPTMTFCTAIVVCIDRGEISMCNAGHTRPILIDGEMEKPQFITPHPNIPLGLMARYKYQSDRLICKSHDTFLMYTDGVTEAISKDKRLFGEKKLMEVLAEKHGVADIVASVKDFAKGTTQSDDITIVSMTIL